MVLVKLQSNLVNCGQTWSTLVKTSQTLRNVLSAMFQEPLSATGPLSSQTRLSLGCLILRVDTQENPRGKNRVMIVLLRNFGYGDSHGHKGKKVVVS